MVRQLHIESFLDELEPHLSYRETKALLILAFERVYLTRLMGRCHGNVALAASTTHMDRKHLSDLLKRHGFEKKPGIE